jgi:hypothetical protein
MDDKIRKDEMLKLANQMDNDKRVKCFLLGWIAVDENYNGIDSHPVRLWKSNGRRKTGRPTKYYLSGLPNVINAIVIEAHTDEQALNEANERL